MAHVYTSYQPTHLLLAARTTLSKHPELTFQEVLQGGPHGTHLWSCCDPVVILLDAHPKCHIHNYKRRVSYVN